MSPQPKHKACKPTPCKAVQPLSMMFGGVACQPWAKTQEVSTQLFSHVGPVSCRHVWCVSKAEVHGGAPICKVHFGSLEGID